MHGVVPETEATAHYYVGFSYDPAEMKQDTAEFIFDSVYKTFLEDVELLELQEINMAALPGAPNIDIVSDSAGLQAARILDELEKAAAAPR
jgi:hypothetical protein